MPRHIADLKGIPARKTISSNRQAAEAGAVHSLSALSLRTLRAAILLHFVQLLVNVHAGEQEQEYSGPGREDAQRDGQAVDLD